MEFNTSVAYINIFVIKKAMINLHERILARRKEIKEKKIQKLMQPYRYFLWIKKQRTRKEAEEYYEMAIHNWENELYEYRPYMNNSFIRCNELLAACRLCEETGMFLSLEDIQLVNNWRS